MFSQVRARPRLLGTVLSTDLPVEVQQPRQPADLVEKPAEQHPVIERCMTDELRLRRLPDCELEIDFEHERIRPGCERGPYPSRLDRVLDYARQDDLAEAAKFHRQAPRLPRIGDLLPASICPEGKHHADENADHVYRKRNEEIRHPVHEATTLSIGALYGRRALCEFAIETARAGFWFPRRSTVKWQPAAPRGCVESIRSTHRPASPRMRRAAAT